MMSLFLRSRSLLQVLLKNGKCIWDGSQGLADDIHGLPQEELVNVLRNGRRTSLQVFHKHISFGHHQLDSVSAMYISLSGKMEICMRSRRKTFT